MSHWTKAKVKVKDLGIFDSLCKDEGIALQKAEETEGELEFVSSWAGSLKAERVLTKNNGQAGLVRDEDGYVLTMDNYHNPLATEYGNDCAQLMQKYAKRVVEEQAVTIGGMIVNEEELDDGSIKLYIEV